MLLACRGLGCLVPFGVDHWPSAALATGQGPQRLGEHPVGQAEVGADAGGDGGQRTDSGAGGQRSVGADAGGSATLQGALGDGGLLRR